MPPNLSSKSSSLPLLHRSEALAAVSNTIELAGQQSPIYKEAEKYAPPPPLNATWRDSTKKIRQTSPN
eukprot:9749790-Ditylum_brightwellii.AAC.2